MAQTYILNPAGAEYETYETNPRRLPRRRADGTFFSNPGRRHRRRRRRRSHHGRHMVAYHNPNPIHYSRHHVRHHRTHRYHRNPSVEQLTGGVGVVDIIGVGAGFLAANEVPIMFGLTGWLNILASGVGGVVIGKVGEGIVGKRAGVMFVAGALADTALKIAGQLSGGRIGIVAGSPQMHIVGPASAGALNSLEARARMALPRPSAGALVQTGPIRMRGASGL